MTTEYVWNGLRVRRNERSGLNQLIEGLQNGND